MVQNPQKSPPLQPTATDPPGLNPISTDAALQLIQLGHYETAAEVLVRVRDAEPENAEVYHCLGLLLTQQGNLPNAIDAWQAATAMDPEHLAAWLQLILAFLKTERLQEAHQACVSACSRFAEEPQAWIASGEVLIRLGNVTAAISSLEKAASLAPDNAELHCRLCELLLKNGLTEDALAHSTRAIELAPDHPAALSQHVAAFRKNGTTDELVRFLKGAVDRHPELPAYQYELCLAREQLDGKTYSAEQAQRALELFPDDLRILLLLVRLLRDLGRSSDIASLVDDRLRRDPDDPLGQSMQANLHYDNGKLPEAEALYRHVLKKHPDMPVVRAALGVLLLTKGEFDEGWPFYASRIHTEFSPVNPIPPLPLWDGRTDRDIDLLVMDEQGLGDSIQFARFLPLARKRVRTLRVVANRRLARLLSPLDQGFADCADIQAIPIGEKDSWRWIPIMSLAQALDVGEADFGAGVPYISAEPDLVDHWKPKMAGTGLRIGIAWQGNPDSGAEAGRSLPLSAFEPIAGLDGVTLYSLQKFHGTEQLETVGFRDRITTFGDDFDAGDDAFIDTAAVMANLDLIITSDTSTAHLAGALGRPVWVALNERPEWRWQREREDSPWYPTMRLFRQRENGNWASVMGRMASAIRDDLADGAWSEAAPAPKTKETE